MKVKVFTPNEKGKIEFTTNELEKLLDEIYEAGYSDGRWKSNWTWTSPTYPYTTTGSPTYTTRDYTITCDNTSKGTTITCDNTSNKTNCTTSTYSSVADALGI